MIKKYFLGLGIVCLSLIGFSSALDLSYTYQNGSYNSIGNDFEVAVYNRGMLGTNYLGNTKRMIGLYSSSSSTTTHRKYFWWNNGYAYFYYYFRGGNNVGKVVGKFNRYLLCEPITRSVVGGTMSLSCGSYEDWGNGTFAEGFFSSISSSDYWGIYKGSNSNKDLRVCFSNSSYGKSICFSNSDPGNYDTISMDSDISYIDFPNYLLGDPPGWSTAGGGQGAGNITGSSGIGVNVNLTGNVMYNTCTNGYVIQRLLEVESAGSSVCYSNTNNTGLIDSNFDGSYSYVNKGLTLFDLLRLENGLGGYSLNKASDYNDWYRSSVDSITRYRQGRLGNSNPFIGRSISVFSYFDNLYYNGYANNIGLSWFGDPIFTLNFCNLYLKSDWNADYNGTYFIDWCSDLNSVGNYNTGYIGDVGSGEVLPPGSSNDGGNGTTNKSGVIVGVDWSGTLSGDTNKNFEGKTFINDFYQKLQANFQKPYNGLVGIVPTYILVFMFALILFRFLSH